MSHLWIIDERRIIIIQLDPSAAAIQSIPSWFNSLDRLENTQFGFSAIHEIDDDPGKKNVTKKKNCLFVLSRGENENKILVPFITLQTWTGTRKREMGDERWNGYLDSRISGIWLKFRSSMISRNWSIQSWKLNKIRPWLRVVRSTWKKRVVKSEFIENRNRHFVGKLKDLDRGLERSLYYTFTQGRWRNIKFWDEQGNKME